MITDEQLREVGFSPLARAFPLSAAGIAWMRYYNCAPATWVHPPGWEYAANEYMRVWIEALARLPSTITARDPGRLPLPSELNLYPF